MYKYKTTNFSNPLVLLVAFLMAFTAPVNAQDTRPTFAQDSRAAVAKLPAVTDAMAVDVDELDDQPVLVTFFASWCPPCRDEFAHLNKLHEKFKDTDLRIVAINVYEAWDDKDAIRMKKFINSTQPAFPAVVGSEEIRNLFGGIDRIPTVYGFNRQGDLTYRFIHKRGSKKTNASLDELEAAATSLLNSGE